MAAASATAAAQSVDVFAGLNALTASQAIQNVPRLGGGLFPSVGANLYFGPIGIGAEASFRANQQSYQGVQLRPAYYDINFLLDPIHFNRSIWPVFAFGLGAQNLSEYAGLTKCGVVGCVSYASTHFTAHLGLALKVYLTQHIFLQPEANFYFIRHNLQYQAPEAQRWGVSLGYSFGGG